jgi:hypothetical protein
MKNNYIMIKFINRISAFLLSMLALIGCYYFIICACGNCPINSCRTSIGICSVEPEIITAGEGLESINIQYHICHDDDHCDNDDWDDNPNIEIWCRIIQDERYRRFEIAEKSDLKEDETKCLTTNWDGSFNEGVSEIGVINLKVGFTDCTFVYKDDIKIPNWILVQDEMKIKVIPEGAPLTENTIAFTNNSPICINFDMESIIKAPVVVTTGNYYKHTIGAYLENNNNKYYFNECILDYYTGSYEPHMEWGGNLETGTYNLYAYLDDQFPIGPISVDCYQAWTTPLYVEYDHQFDYEIDFDYDILNTTFGVTGRTLSFNLDQMNLDNKIISFKYGDDEDFTQSVKKYIGENKSSINTNAYICGIRGFGLVDSVTGEEIKIYTDYAGGSIGGFREYAGSLICVGLYNGEIESRTSIAFQKVILHELGHHLGGLDHPKNLNKQCFNSYSCVMNQGTKTVDSSDPFIGNYSTIEYDLLNNIHYCDECINGTDKMKAFINVCGF